MKKLIVLALLLPCFCCSSFAQQLRKVRADEVSFYNAMHAAMYGSLPHPYKDWTEVGDPEKFDVLDFFCNGAFNLAECRGNVGVRLGVKDSYQLNDFVDYTMPDDQKQSIVSQSMSMITDYNNASQIAASLKNMRKTKLQIHIFMNIDAPTSATFPFVYCSKTQPTILKIPIPVTLAILGERSAQCPVMSDGRPNMSPSGDAYTDDALIFLGKPVTVKQTSPDGDGLVRTDYGIGFDNTKIGALKVQNIVVQFKGDAADIKAAIEAMDWQKLYALVAK